MDISFRETNGHMQGLVYGSIMKGTWIHTCYDLHCELNHRKMSRDRD